MIEARLPTITASSGGIDTKNLPALPRGGANLLTQPRAVSLRRAALLLRAEAEPPCGHASYDHKDAEQQQHQGVADHRSEQPFQNEYPPAERALGNATTRH